MLDQYSIELKGPGQTILQGTTFTPRVNQTASVIVDHPKADFYMIGGNIANASGLSLISGDHIFHLWQKQGWLRVYGTGFQVTNGIADVRIDSRSKRGPHVITNVRSEGNNGVREGEFPSALLYVPPTNQAVDVVMKSNTGEWNSPGMGGPGLAHFVDYNVAGTLWLLGNHSNGGAGKLVIGHAPGATVVVALGNHSWGTANIIATTGANVMAVGNIYLNSSTNVVEFSNADTLEDHPDLPEIPNVKALPAIQRPVLNVALPGMLDVTEPPFSAVGDGITDDTEVIQLALDEPNNGNHLYFPEGTYRITDTLVYNHTLSATFHSFGGWIAGAGRDRSIIVRDAVDKGGVFAAERMAFMTIQGLTFRTTTWDPNDPNPIAESAFALENVDGIGHATQEIQFYDVRFDGGGTRLILVSIPRKTALKT